MAVRSFEELHAETMRLYDQQRFTEAFDLLARENRRRGSEEDGDKSSHLEGVLVPKGGLRRGAG